MPKPDSSQQLEDSFVKQLEGANPDESDENQDDQNVGDDDEEDLGEGDSQLADETGESEGENADEEGEGGEEEIAPHIQPPLSMNAEEITHFHSMPVEMQNFVSRRDVERDVHFQREQNTLAVDRKEVQALREQATEQLKLHSDNLSQFLGQEINPPNPALRSTDPETYDDEMATYVHSIHLQKQAQAKLSDVRAVQNAELVKHQNQQAVEVVRLIPEFADPVKGPQLQSQINTYAQSLGYSLEEMAHVSARDAVVLHKAMLYDHAKSSGKKIAKSSPGKAPKTAKSGASRGVGKAQEAKIQSLRKRLKGGDNRAAVDLFQMGLDAEQRGKQK